MWSNYHGRQAGASNTQITAGEERNEISLGLEVFYTKNWLDAASNLKYHLRVLNNFSEFFSMQIDTFFRFFKSFVFFLGKIKQDKQVQLSLIFIFSSL